MRLKSCIYAGRVRHIRKEPVRHKFSYRLFMMYLDLSELPTLFEPYRGWSGHSPAFAWFDRADHLGSPDVALDEAVRDLVSHEAGRRPVGPIRLLTHLRYFGYCFNPVSFYYCFDRADTRVEYIVAEVNNTPWGERHCYVLSCEETKAAQRFRPAKALHVSPFMPMSVEYEWSFSSPGSSLDVYMTSSVESRRMFHASLLLERREINRSSLRSVLFTFPFMTGKVVAAIYWQALRLWFRRVPIFAHPNKQKAVAAKQR